MKYILPAAVAISVLILGYGAGAQAQTEQKLDANGCVINEYTWTNIVVGNHDRRHETKMLAWQGLIDDPTMRESVKDMAREQIRKMTEQHNKWRALLVSEGKKLGDICVRPGGGDPTGVKIFNHGSFGTTIKYRGSIYTY